MPHFYEDKTENVSIFPLKKGESAKVHPLLLFYSSIMAMEACMAYAYMFTIASYNSCLPLTCLGSPTVLA